MNFSKLTLASFLAQAAFFNLAGTNKALLCSATVLEQQEEGTLQDGDFSNNNSNLRGSTFQSSNRILSSDDGVDQFIVKFKTHEDFVTEDMKLQSDPHQIMSLPDDDIEVMAFESEEELQYWEERDDVEYVEPDHKVYPLAERTPYGIKSVKALSVSDASVSNQKVCIIDSGYDINHPDLQSSRRIVTGHSQVTTSYWFWDGSSHGTHVAGTIAAIGGNNQGVVGVNRNGQLKLHIVKIFDDCGKWTRTSDLIRAVENCAAAGATVVNMSLTHSDSLAVKNAMARIYKRGILLVAAAGNNGTASKSYPASYPSVMSVAGVDSNNNKYSGSQFNDQVDIAAPGVDVLSTLPGGGYGYKTGTSMASPHVSGVAALVWSHFPTKTAQQIRQALESTAQDLGLAGRDDIFGHGLVRADLAYNYLKQINYNDQVYLQVNNLDNRWLSGGRGTGNEGVVSRNHLGSNYEKKGIAAYQWIVRSTPGNGSRLYVDPKKGKCVKYDEIINLQVNNLDYRWLSGGRGTGNEGVVSRNHLGSNYEKKGIAAYQWIVRKAPGDGTRS